MASSTKLVADLSHWNGKHSASDFEEAAKHGLSGLMFKATDGASFDDPLFRSYVSAAEKANLPWGAYVFVEAGPGGPQAENFLDEVHHSSARASWFLVDWERGSRSAAKSIVAYLKKNAKLPVLSYLGQYARANGGELGNEDGAFVPSYGPARLDPSYKPKNTPLVAWQYTDGKYNGTKHPSSFPGLGAVDCSVIYKPRLIGLGPKRKK